MPRKRRHTEPPVTLFPFLSVLACVIGALTLLITTIALAQLDPKQIERMQRSVREQTARVQAYEQVQERTKDAQMTAEWRARRAEEAAAPLRELADVTTQVGELIEQRGRLVQENEELRALSEQSQALQTRVAELTVQSERLAQSAAAARDELIERETPLSPTVQVRPGGTGTRLDPVFVECDAKRIVIHRDGRAVAVARGALSTDETWLGLLDAVAADEKRTVVFLVRPDGVATYYTARNAARSRYARNGKLPVVGDGPLDLSLFEADDPG
jgi:hypothetical protein